MGGVVSGVTDSIGLTDSTETGDAARKGAKIAANAEREALDYLKEREALPTQYGDAAIQDVGREFGLSFDEEGERIGGDQTLLERAQQSPLYGAIMSTQQAGEEAILRNASATGGLRSGNVQDALAENSQKLQERALLESYNQQLSGLQGLSNLPSNANAIAAQTAGIGQTLSQGLIAEKQNNAAAQNQIFQDAIGATTAALTGGNVGGFSDERLKTNIVRTGRVNGYTWYSWTWNKLGEALGLLGDSVGVIAQEVQEVNPEAVGESQGYLTVDYSQILGAH